MAKALPQLVACVVIGAAIAGGTKHGGHGILANLTSASGSGGNSSANARLGREMASQMGWTAGNGQWQCLDTLWQGESGWSQHADTRASGLDSWSSPVFAYGIPQSRPVTKMPRSAWPSSMGGRSNPKAQIRWGLQYIQATYGSPCSALAYKRSTGNQGY